MDCRKKVIFWREMVDSQDALLRATDQPEMIVNAFLFCHNFSIFYFLILKIDVKWLFLGIELKMTQNTF